MKKDSIVIDNVVSSLYMSLVTLPVMPTEVSNAQRMTYTLANAYGVDLAKINKKILKKQVNKTVADLQADPMYMLRLQSSVTGLVSALTCLVYEFKTDKENFSLLAFTETIANTLLVIWVVEKLLKGV